MDSYRGSEWRKWDLHLHTASSYDSQYKGEDADILLCKTLHDNNISAVAITDHFIIDDTRISHLREIAPDIVFFPGVELRTDKGANNLHLIILFSEETDIKMLSEDFNVIMRREKAKQKDSNDTIYWLFEDIDMSEKKVANKLEFYNYLFGLDYIGVSFKLKMGGRSLEELSPGERGIVLLIFYLALSKNNTPIIIDQPEDNLDNQSVYNKLVPCICAAKKKRQVIIVTHNPNIAVACDAEQIIYCHMDKNRYAVTYEAGAIENREVKKHVVDVLEGTMPAFNLRKKKYLQTNKEDLLGNL